MEHTFVVEQKGLLAILSSMQPICAKRTTAEATSSILFQVGHRELVLKSTDLEISLQASCPLRGIIATDPVSFLVSGRRIFELVKELDGDITFSLQEAQLNLKAGTVNLSLNIKDANDFPPFPERIENRMQFDADFLLALLNRVAFIVPQANANPALNGLFLEIDSQELKMTATDGHCLAQVCTPKYTLPEPVSWLMPRRAVFEIKKILEGLKEQRIFLGTCSNQLVFSGESFNFFTKLLSDSFPQYKAVLGRDAFTPATLDRAPFLKALRRSACLLSGQFIATKFGFGPEALKVSMHNKEVGHLEEEIPLKNFQGALIDVRFYAPYLLNGLQAFSHEEVTFYLNNSSKPIIFEAQGENYAMVYLVMPVAPTHGQP